MNLLELIDRLCAVTESQARIIREQAYCIDNCLGIDAETRKHFAALRKPVETELDILEYRLRPIHNTGCGKECSHERLDLSASRQDFREESRNSDRTEEGNE